MNNEQPTTEQRLPPWPKQPERANAGRYGNVQWMYAEYVGEYDYIGRKYELDRAEAAIARLKHAVEVLRCIRANWMQKQSKVLLVDGADIQHVIDACEVPADD